ncbi:MAG TPA: MFS transporter [Patescibacteria group bacterium]
MEDKKNKFGFSVSVWIMGLVSFLNDVSTEMINPVLPIFITTVLGAPASVVGLIEGIADATSNFLMALTGIASDKIKKRKPFVISGYGLSTISKIIYSMSYSWPMVLVGRVTNRAGKGVRTTARDALIVEATEKEDRGKSFGLHRMMDNAGAIFGPMLSIGVLGLLNNNYRLMFFWAFIPSALAMLLLVFLKERKKNPGEDEDIHFDWKKTNSSFRIFLFISLIFALASSSYAFLILRAQNLGMSVSLTILAYILFNLSTSLTALPAGLLADKIGPKKIIFSGYLLFALVYFAFGVAKSDWVVWVLFPAYGVYLGMTEGIGKAYISRLIPHEVAASGFGIYQTLLGFTTFFSSFIAGLIWTKFGPSYPFFLSSILALIAALLFLILSKKINIHPQAASVSHLLQKHNL